MPLQELLLKVAQWLVGFQEMEVELHWAELMAELSKKFALNTISFTTY